ncbi:hypothetical protein LG651_03025 [Tamlana sp. 62-3]|uniref:Uncharacterized protein n=1 Tax=Neotamlana sargassicola TaxID=2883125 RepID=A0A9X1I3H1_9FLAO|nr:hypothetical protein [Tamlana sargassicola]MCB4807210.1 hypothetical protein [Tamlana sargassicola]
MGKPYGGGALGGGGLVCPTHTKLINTNKIETNILLFCSVMGSQMYEKKRARKVNSLLMTKKNL